MADLPTERQSAPRPDDTSGVDLDQIAERLRWTPRERLRYFLDLVRFVEQARRARRVPTDA